jgi:hypothetical protein
MSRGESVVRFAGKIWISLSLIMALATSSHSSVHAAAQSKVNIQLPIRELAAMLQLRAQWDQNISFLLT